MDSIKKPVLCGFCGKEFDYTVYPDATFINSAISKGEIDPSMMHEDGGYAHLHICRLSIKMALSEQN